MNPVVAKLALALSIGLLVGLERGWREREAPAGSRTAGIRTFGISGLLGGILAAAGEAFHYPLVFPVGFLTFGIIFTVFKLREARQDGDYSVTAVVAGLSVFALGGLAVVGDAVAAAAGGAAVAATLASRDVLHGFLKRLTWVELRSALMLAVMTAVILPVLPDRAVDPWGGFNPWEIWFFTVLTASMSFLGYIAVRVFGSRKGMLLSALAGALVSSTAVTLVLARSAKATGGALPLAGAASLAAMVSVTRVIGLVLIVDPGVIASVGPAAAVAALSFACFGLSMSLWPHGNPAVDVPASNPFEIRALLIFAAIFATAVAASAVLVAHFGSSGLLATVALSGTVDVDVAVLTAMRVGTATISPSAIGQAVLVALAANAIGRVVLASAVGPVAYSAPLAAATGVAIAAAALAHFALL